MELATALIWTLRIVLPIFLFCIYFKLQAPKDESLARESEAPRGPGCSRREMLAHRRAVRDCPAPDVLADIQLKDKSEAPVLFEGAPAERKGRGERRERRERRAKDGEDEAPAGDASALSPAQDKMHIETLLNYVAFNRKEQQRNFLLEADVPPPPPPKAAAACWLNPEASASAERANEEARTILMGALHFKRSDIARDLYSQLARCSVELDERTFALMIDACILARDFKGASDLLMKMETAGFCPQSELLDKVMDLYSEQKSQLAAQRRRAGEPSDVAPAPGAPYVAQAPLTTVEVILTGPRARLSSEAPIFVPAFSATAPASVDASPAADATPLQPPRTKLTSSAKPFEPQFGFDPYMYTWSAGPSRGEQEEEGQGERGLPERPQADGGEVTEAPGPSLRSAL